MSALKTVKYEYGNLTVQFQCQFPDLMLLLKHYVRYYNWGPLTEGLPLYIFLTSNEYNYFKIKTFLSDDI